MTLDELITDLKAAGANANTMQLAMNCYELGLKNATEVERKASAEHHLGIMRGAIAGAVAAEREACARLCEAIGNDANGYGCARQIRARSKA